jgi:hypothetical protein
MARRQRRTHSASSKAQVAVVARGLPKTIRLDNGPEFAGKALDA